MNYDKILCKIFFIDNWHLNQSYLNKYKRNYKKRKKYINIINYLENRYDDSESFKETIYRMNNNINIRPVCKSCGNKVKFIGKGNKLFASYCCNSCSAQNKNTTIKKKQTLLEHWGTENCYDSEKYKKIIKEKYGVEYYYQSEEFKQKRKESMIEKYGSSTFNNIKKRIKTSLEKYGVENYCQLDEAKLKISKTYVKNIKNGKITTNISSDEKLIFYILKKIYKDTEQYHIDKRYPFKCDFYIKSLDLFIEYNGSQYHHGHPFNVNDENDLKELSKLKLRNEELINKGKKINQYSSIIYTWTDLDVRKFNIAKENNLNYLVFYTYEDFKKWIVDIIIEKHYKKEFKKIQNIKFPKTTVYDITLESCLKEFNNLCKNTYLKTNQTNSYIIKYFHKNIIYAKKKKSLSPYDGWINIKSNIESFKKYYKNRLIYSTYYKNNIDDFINGIIPEHVLGYGLTASSIYPFVSTFKPTLAKYIIKNYLNEYDTIFDPFSGYSGRMLGTLACNKNYIGQDLCKDTVNESNEIYNFLKPYIKNTVDIKCKDSINETGEYECLFTCPPYNDLENWPDIELKNYSCDEWIDICLKNYKCNKYVFVVDNKIEKYKKYIVDSIENKSHLSTNIEYIVIIEKR